MASSDNPFDSTPASRGGAYTAEESVMVNEALRTHRATTQAAERALKTAEKTKEVALATLDDLHEQGEQLGRVQRDLNVIDADVEESRSIVKFMRRCCLFFLCSCCCECDPDAERDALRKARVRARRAAKKKEVEALGRIEERKKAAAGVAAAAEEEKANGKKRGGKKGGAKEEAPPKPQPARRDPRLDDPSTEDAARAQLFGGGGAGGGASSSYEDSAALPSERSGAAYQLGGALADAEREAVARETGAQEAALDAIGGALADLRQMGLGMQEELRRQDPRIDGVADHAQRARDDILHVSRSAQKGFGVKPVRQPEGPVTIGGGGASTAVAKAAGKAAAKAAGKSLGL